MFSQILTMITMVWPWLFWSTKLQSITMPVWDHDMNHGWAWSTMPWGGPWLTMMNHGSTMAWFTMVPFHLGKASGNVKFKPTRELWQPYVKRVRVRQTREMHATSSFCVDFPGVCCITVVHGAWKVWIRVWNELPVIQCYSELVFPTWIGFHWIGVCNMPEAHSHTFLTLQKSGGDTLAFTSLHRSVQPQVVLELCMLPVR